MMLILDNNIFFSLMKPDSVASYLLSALKAKFFAPELIKEELEKYKSECLTKSRLSEHEFEIRQKEVEECIEFFESSEYKKFLKEAINALPDAKDSPYLALALFKKASIWSNDPHLKEQSLVKVYSTKELVEILLADEL